MLVFRLFRVGKINQPSFKIVVTDKRNPAKGGRFVEQVGFYNPITKEKILNKERTQYWLSQGVQPSATLHNLLIKEGILEGKKIPKQKKSKKAPVPVPAPAPVEAPKVESQGP
ncbi:MAG: 30S ribosomal protein S16 [Candidatus Nealsonbacteria bacterium]